MSKRPQFPTPIQDIAINLTFAVMGEERVNRTYDEYMAIAARLPPLKVLTFKINQLLQQLHKCNGCNGLLLYCGPVLRHAAEPTQAANCRSSAAS